MAPQLRTIARDDERAARDERRLLNRLRADLLATFPAAVAIAGDTFGAPRFLRMLQRWPTAEALAAVTRKRLIEFARAQRTGYVEKFADRVLRHWLPTTSSPRLTWSQPRSTPSAS